MTRSPRSALSYSPAAEIFVPGRALPAGSEPPACGGSEARCRFWWAILDSGRGEVVHGAVDASPRSCTTGTAQYAGAKRRVHLSGASPCLEGLEYDRDQQAGLLSLVGHPGLEPGANGLRTQRLALHKALFVSDSDTPAPAISATKGHHATNSGHRDRLDRAGLVAKIHAALYSARDGIVV